MQTSNDLSHLTVLLERQTIKIAAGQTLCCLQGKGWKIEAIFESKEFGLPESVLPTLMRDLMVSRNPSKMGTVQLKNDVLEKVTPPEYGNFGCSNRMVSHCKPWTRKKLHFFLSIDDRFKKISQFSRFFFF